MEDIVTEKLKDRIRERMQRLGKNPSSVALDAGLSRSAVRDILSGKARNPGIVTLYAIANALECSHNYLMGFDDDVHYRESPDILIDVSARTSDISGVLETGVFKQIPEDNYPTRDENFEFTVPRKFGYRERHPFRSKRRYLFRDLYLYRMGDASLEGIKIAKGDLLVAVDDPERLDLKDGHVVIAAHRLPGVNVEELSARMVIKDGERVILRSTNSNIAYAQIELKEPGEEPATFSTTAGGKVHIEGVVVELTRQLDVGFISQGS